MVALAACHETGRDTVTLKPDSTKTKHATLALHTRPPAKKKKKKIYLTFDDGPNKGTSKVLHIMQQESVPVTFFIVGEHVFASVGQRQTWDSLMMAQHIELCNHSYSHAHNHYSAWYNHPGAVVEDFKRSNDSLQFSNPICRTPGRNAWRIDTLQFTDLKRSKNAVDSLQQAGFTIMGWDLEWEFNGKDLCLKNSADDLLRQIDSVFAHHETRSPECLVLLAHDQVYADADDSAELHDFIRKLKMNDAYELELVSNYPGVKIMP
ncbi:MAG TPA: polysaccharide deacetylase family protein [Chitinophagaceae bacterium]|nr:polysaccharide deacetylase family protein [Chitinophagaceae bacterium]